MTVVHFVDASNHDAAAAAALFFFFWFKTQITNVFSLLYFFVVGWNRSKSTDYFPIKSNAFDKRKFTKK